MNEETQRKTASRSTADTGHGSLPGLPTVDAFCTICSLNYLAKAATLMQSVREHHPSSRRVLLLTDGNPESPFPDCFSEIMDVSELGLPDSQTFKFRYDLLEFNTACKPWLLQRLLERGYDN